MKALRFPFSDSLLLLASVAIKKAGEGFPAFRAVRCERVKLCAALSVED